jgi:hypothetical protein
VNICSELRIEQMVLCVVVVFIFIMMVHAVLHQVASRSVVCCGTHSCNL